MTGTFFYHWFTNTSGYFITVLPWLIIGLGASVILKKYLTPGLIKRFLGKSSIPAILIAELIGASSPVSVIALLPLSSFMLTEGASPATLTAFLLAARAYNPEAFPISISLLGVSITVLSLITIFIAVTICSLLLQRSKHFVIEPVEKDEKSFIKQMIQVSIYVLLGVIIAGLIVTAIPASEVAKIGGSSILSIPIAVALGFSIYLYYVGYFPIAKSLLAVGLSHAAVITFLSSAGIINLTFLLMFMPVIGKRNTIKIFLIYLLTILITGSILFLLHIS